MAKTTEQIHAEMLADVAASNILGPLLTSTSLSAVYRNFLFIVAKSIATLGSFFDSHKDEVEQIIYDQKSGRMPWYRTMALNFLYGFSLVTDHDNFYIGDATPEQVEAARIIKYAAVNEVEDSSRLIIKIAGETAGILSPISPEQLEAFEDYIKEIKWAGVATTVINYLPDRLFLNVQVKRNPLLLDGNGRSILNGNYPVRDGIAEYMKVLPFNGEMRINMLEDKMRAAPGVIDATVILAQSSWIDADADDYGAPHVISIADIPVSGYYQVINYDDISYVV